MELVNKAKETINNILNDNISEGLMCLDACLCIGDDFCSAQD